MSLTPFRDAALATVDAARRRSDAHGPRDPVQDIAERMSLDTCAATIVGVADLKDLNVPPAVYGTVLLRVLSAALASFLLSTTGRDESMAIRFVDVVLQDMRNLTIERIRAARTDGVSAGVDTSTSWGLA